MLDWAKYYIGRGLPVIPLRGKVPILKDWTNLAPTPELVETWWTNQPGANIGLMCGKVSGIVDVETDIHGDLIGEDSLVAWAKEAGCDLGKPWTFRSGRGGIHRLYRCGMPVPNRKDVLPAVDVRGDGGQCVLPPSIHPETGTRYEWLEGPTEAPDGPGVIPFTLFMLIAGDNFKAPLEVPETIEEGGRNDTLFRLASKLRGAGLDAEEISATLRSVNMSRCSPPLDDEELERIARSASRYEQGKDTEGHAPHLVSASSIPYEPPRWTIPPYFQRGKGTLIQGDNGTGKTAFVCGIVAHVTSGRDLLGIPVNTPGDVLILSVEDDLPVLRGRLEADGADLDKCHFMTNAAGLRFTDPEVEEAIKAVHAKMVVFDPFQAFLGSDVDMNKSNQTRPELAKLFEMCERNDCACVIIAHTGKNGDKSPVNRSLGSVDIPAAMRSILELTKNPDNEEERIMVHVKCSNAPRGQSIAYTIGDRGGVHWIGFNPMTPEDLTITKKRKKKGIPYEAEPLVRVFKQLVKDRPGGGFWPYTELHRKGSEILGYPPYDGVGDLKDKLDNGLAKELQQRDGLIVTHGEKDRKNRRGIRIDQYKPQE